MKKIFSAWSAPRKVLCTVSALVFLCGAGFLLFFLLAPQEGAIMAMGESGEWYEYAKVAGEVERGFTGWLVGAMAVTAAALVSCIGCFFVKRPA